MNLINFDKDNLTLNKNFLSSFLIGLGKFVLAIAMFISIFIGNSLILFFIVRLFVQGRISSLVLVGIILIITIFFILVGLNSISMFKNQARLPNKVAKRSLDVILVLGSLILLAPIMIAVAILIKIDSTGPVFNRQQRLGMAGDIFDLYKFRTIYEETGDIKKLTKPPRVTRVGRLLRSTSLDELPTFFNVLRGEMSLVGPRAIPPNKAELYEGGKQRRFEMRPGITGLWQVSMSPERVQFDDINYQSQIDLYYIDNWNLLFDIYVLFRTIPAVFNNYGAS